MKKIFNLSFLLTASLFFCPSTYADSPKVGDTAPALCVKSGDDKVLTLDQLKGKVIVVFYNSKDTTGQDSKLRQVLNRYYDEQPDNKKALVFKLVIIDCSSAFYPVDIIWKKKLIEASKQKKLDIYGDWDGNAAKTYSFSDDESNLVIIDKKGVIRYINRREITDEKEINAIVTLLNEIT